MKTVPLKTHAAVRLGWQIKEARKAAGLSIPAAAKRLRVTESYVRTAEREGKPSESLTRRMAYAYSAPLDLFYKSLSDASLETCLRSIRATAIVSGASHLPISLGSREHARRTSPSLAAGSPLIDPAAPPLGKDA